MKMLGSEHKVRGVVFTEFYRVLPSFTEFYRVLPRWALFSGATLTRSGPSSIQSFKEKGPYFRPLFVELP